jgi:hypothetical protein
MEVRVWKNGKPLDFTGHNAVTALAILFLEKEVRLGIIKRFNGGYFVELLSKSGKLIGSVAYKSEDEYRTIYALAVAGRVKRELKKREERRVNIKTILN